MGEDSELVRRDKATVLAAAGAHMDETSLTFSDPSKVTYEQLAAIAGSLLAPIGRGYPWWVGDLLNMAEDLFGEEWSQLEALLPNSPGTQANYKSIAKHVPRSRRRGLHLSVVEPVAYLEPRKRDELIAQAVAGGWKREEMREAARAEKILMAGGNPNLLPAPPRKTCPNCGCALEES